MTIDNCLEALLPLENNKKRKMKKRTKNRIIDYQTNNKKRKMRNRMKKKNH